MNQEARAALDKIENHDSMRDDWSVVVRSIETLEEIITRMESGLENIFQNSKDNWAAAVAEGALGRGKFATLEALNPASRTEEIERCLENGTTWLGN